MKRKDSACFLGVLSVSPICGSERSSPMLPCFFCFCFYWIGIIRFACLFFIQFSVQRTSREKTGKFLRSLLVGATLQLIITPSPTLRFFLCVFQLNWTNSFCLFVLDSIFYSTHIKRKARYCFNGLIVAWCVWDRALSKMKNRFRFVVWKKKEIKN